MKFLASLVFLVTLSLVVSGQIACDKARLVGAWVPEIGVMRWPVNIDSLLAAVEAPHQNLWVQSKYLFRNDGTFEIETMSACDGSPQGEEGHYSISEDDCEIRFKEKQHHHWAWSILFLNKEFLVCKQRNPKHSVVVVYRRK